MGVFRKVEPRIVNFNRVTAMLSVEVSSARELRGMYALRSPNDQPLTSIVLGVGDLPGEFTRCSNANHHDRFAHLAKRVLYFPELDFVLSECSKDREGKQPSVLSIRCCLLNGPLLPTAAIESRAIHRGLVGLAGPQGPRAPPSIVSL